MATLANDLIKSVFRRRTEFGGDLARNFSRYTLALCDLVEAEGRDLKRAVMQTGMALGLVLVVSVLLLTGLGFVLHSIYLWLLDVMDPAPATLSTGLLTLGVAALCGFLAKKVSQT